MSAFYETVETRFNRFHRENPHVYELFKLYVRELLAAGNTKLSSKLIINRIRWEQCITTNGDPYLIDDRYTAWYARKYIRDYPARSDKFELREIRTP